MKQNLFHTFGRVGLAALLLGGPAGLVCAQTADLVISSFDNNSDGCGIWYGSSTITWDGTVDNTGNGGGSLYVTCPDDASSDTPLNPYICIGGGNPWWNGPGSVDLTQYKAIEFDIKWDNTSLLSIDQFDQPSTWPTNFGAAGAFSGSDPANGINIKAVTGGNGTFVQLGVTNIPSAASNGWVHISFPIDPTITGINNCNGIDLQKWINNNGSIVGAATVHFWIDNVRLKGTAGPPPPPTVSIPTKATAGLNVFASTKGNSYYDRQEAVLQQSTGLSWVGHASSANPVTYSFTIAGYPNSVNCEAYLFLAPNPAAVDSAPDWNETNCALAYIQGNLNNAVLRFQYKVNEDHQQAMFSGGSENRGSYTNPPGSWDGVTTPWLESGNLGSVTNNTVLGTWTLKFTSDTNLTLIAPNGNTSSCVIPPYNAGYFAENSGFNVYLGMQANQADAMNQAVVYSDFAVSNVASPFHENFLSDTNLDTVNTWTTSVSGGPKGVLIVPQDGGSQWITWTLPDSGFGLQASPDLLSPLLWNDLTAGPVVPMYGVKAQLISANEVPAGNAAFFRLVKRTFTQLQVLFPGETNAPNTTTGKVGAPAPVPAGSLVNVTVNAVDSTYHVVSVTGDMITLTGSDPNNVTPEAASGSLSSGSMQMQVYFAAAGGFTVTAQDTTDTNIPPATSSSLTVQ